MPVSIFDNPALDDIYRYLNDIKFMDKRNPKNDTNSLSDEYIKLNNDGKTNTISFGHIIDLPEYITALKAMILKLTNSYHPDFQKEFRK